MVIELYKNRLGCTFPKHNQTHDHFPDKKLYQTDNYFFSAVKPDL